jgi:tetratricopeptide (TPR) repeat protein
LLAAAKQIAGNFQVGDRSFEFVVKARTELKQWKELEQDALQQLKSKSGDARALNAGATAAISSGNREKAAEYLKQLAALQFAGKEEHLLNAWHALLLNGVSEPVLGALVRNRNSYMVDPDVDYAIGLLQAATGKTEEAKHSLTVALDADDFNHLDPKPFVLLGKLAEQVGLPDAAQAAYAKARTAPRVDETSDWAAALIPTAGAAQH